MFPVQATLWYSDDERYRDRVDALSVIEESRHERAKVTNITAIHWSPSATTEPKSCQVTTFFVLLNPKIQPRQCPGEQKETR